MVKQIKSSEIKKFIDKNPNTVLLDVRTENEWNTVGKPDTKNLGIKSYFITISQDNGFLESVSPSRKTLTILSNYIGYRSYEAFLNRNAVDNL